MADVVFTAAHKVVIDCLGFIVSERVDTANRQPVFDLLAEALPQARATESPILDRMILAAIEVSAAQRRLIAREPEAGLSWMAAHMAASTIFAEFSLWRLALSGAKFQETLATDGAA